MIRFIVSDIEAGKRIDGVVAQHAESLSRSSVQKLCDDGKVTVNNKIEKTSKKVNIGDKIEVDYTPPSDSEIPDIEIPVIYEDDDCLVINKPVGVLTHSKGAFNPEATVATFVKNKLNNISGDRAGIVHRLDRATSGVMIVAKSPVALSWLQKQFSTRKVKKTYSAIIEGTLDPVEAIIDMPIERNPKRPQTFRVGSNGKTAQTHYQVQRSNSEYSLVLLSPKTGRTHQLRVHLHKLGHPIVGDTLYGGKPAGRLYLHALSLEITLPNRQRQLFEVPAPAEFKKLMVV